MNGRLLGINTAIVSRSGGYQGIGFAIPSNMAVQVKDAIVGHGKVMRGYLGVAIQNVTEDLAKSMNLQARRGVLVSDVTPGSPAAKAGIKRGNVGQPHRDNVHRRLPQGGEAERG
jgi:serine protease Do